MVLPEGNPSLLAGSGASRTMLVCASIAYANKHALSSQWMSQNNTSLGRNLTGLQAEAVDFQVCFLSSDTIPVPKGWGLPCITWLIVEEVLQILASGSPSQSFWVSCKEQLRISSTFWQEKIHSGLVFSWKCVRLQDSSASWQQSHQRHYGFKWRVWKY